MGCGIWVVGFGVWDGWDGCVGWGCVEWMWDGDGGLFKGMLTRIFKGDFADFADAWAFWGSFDMASETVILELMLGQRA